MQATRNAPTSTTQGLSDLITLIQTPNSDVRLFVTNRKPIGNYDPVTDGPDNNLPWLVAIAHDTKRWIIFDGAFLTAARTSRSIDVKALLDAAIQDGTVRFTSHAVEFTSQMDPVSAASYLVGLPTQLLTANSRIELAKLFTDFSPQDL